MTRSVSWGHGDSAFYIGETPPQKNPKQTNLSHLKGFENVLGYSGTNSKYVRIHDSMFFNNGIGIVPNTLDSELFEPNADGIIEDNKIFWNNFNYYMPDSPVHTVSGGLGQIGELTINYPTGIGVVMLGSDGWKVRDNDVFGNFMWGIASFSDPFNEGGDAVNQNNRYLNNRMGRGGTDVNQFDFWDDGSGSGNCWSGNVAGDPPSEGEVTFRDAGNPTPALYPDCPPTGGTGTSGGDGEQLGELIGYVTADPPCKQQDSWEEHSHPPFRGLEPLEVGGTCQ